MIVLYRWRRPAAPNGLPAEDVFGAMRAGVRYVRHSPPVHAVLLRTGAFIFGGSALWALLPLVAREDLGLGATGYGLILGCLGMGAVGGGLLLPRIERQLSTDALLAGAVVLFALATAGPIYAQQLTVLSLIMIIGGIAWIAIMSTFNVAAQVTVPGWVRARALAVYGIVAQGGMAVGSTFWGLVAERVSLSMTLILAAGTLVASIATALRYRLGFEEAIDLTPSEHWPEPIFATEPEPDAGPVLITVE